MTKFLSITALSLFIVFGLAYLFLDKLGPDYPVSRIVTNKDGKTLECHIVGKSGGFLVVERKLDNVRFNIELESLSLESRLYSLILPNKPAPDLPKYPITRSLQNVEGKSVFVNILGKSGTTLHVSRRADDVRFEIDLKTLSDKDQEYASRLPDRTPPPLEKQDGFVETRLALIADLEKKLELYENEVLSRTLPIALARKRAEQVLELENEIKGLEIAIEGYKYRVRSN